MYTINCTTPIDGPCIESDQIDHRDRRRRRQLHDPRQGTNEAATVCWTNNDSLVVPPLGATLTRTLNLGFASATAGCM